MGRYEEYCFLMEDFARDLNDRQLIINNSVVRDSAKEIFSTEYKKRARCSFSVFLQDMLEMSILQSFRRDRITYNPKSLHYILVEAPKERGEGHKIARKKVLVSQLFAFKKEKPPVQVVSLKACQLCNVPFDSAEKYDEHLREEEHTLRHMYATNRKQLIVPDGNIRRNEDIVIEIVDRHNSGPETILLGKDDSIMLKIKNTSTQDYSIVSIVKLNMNTTEVDTQALELPCSLKRGSVVLQTVLGNLTESRSVMFPQIFRFKRSDGFMHNVVKELIVHSSAEESIIRDLLPAKPYRKPKSVFLDQGGIIVPGEEPKYTKSSDPYQIPGKYPLPKDVIEVLNAGLKEFSGMTASQERWLNDIKSLLDTEDPLHSLKMTNYYKMLSMFIYMEEHQLQKDIHDYDREDQILRPAAGFKNNFFMLDVPGLAEHRPSLIVRDQILVTDSPGVMYQGFVHKVMENSVVLGFNESFGNNVHAQNKKFFVRFTINRHTLRMEHQAVTLAEKDHLAAYFFPTQVPNHPLRETHMYKWFNPRIHSNEQQQQAVKYIVEDSPIRAPYLIFGPPGTGKTVTLVEAVKQLYHLKPQAKILICAPSNNAANEIMKRLVDTIPRRDILRYLSFSCNYSEIPESILKFTNYNYGEFYHPSITNLMEYRIVVSTLMNAARFYNMGIRAKHFSYVFIDESGHATESETLIPIAGILSGRDGLSQIDGRVVLVGDPKQLGPIIHSVLAKEHGFGISMLERMMNDLMVYKKNEDGQYNPSVLTKLLKNYRSHPAILKLPNERFYDGELEPCGNAEVNIAVGWEYLPNPKFPIIFHSVIGEDQREENSPSFFNLPEVTVVLDYLKKLIGSRLSGMLIKQDHIAVVTPYRKQAEKLTKACRKLNWHNITIGSVEQIQGQERLIVIVSTVRSRTNFMNFDHKFHLGFVKSPKRFNVAVTRAKALLIVVGNPNLLRYDEEWQRFIEYCQNNDGFRGPPPSPLQEVAVEDLAAGVSQLNINDNSVNIGPEDKPDFARGRV